MSHNLLVGPMFARSYHGILVQDEEFCLQLDSHMKTVQHWDSELVQMWGRTNNEYAVLSTAPLDISEMDTFSSRLDDFQEVPHLCNHYFTEEGLPKNVRPTTAFLKDPILTAGWSAGFSFSKCHLDAKVLAFNIIYVTTWLINILLGTLRSKLSKFGRWRRFFAICSV